MLYKDIAKYVRILTILALWTATFYISGNLFGGDVVLPTPFTKQNVVAQNDHKITSDTDYEVVHYSDLPIKISIYDPELLGINCMDPCSMMASGQLVEDWWGEAAACASEFPFGTKIWIEGVGVVTCQDRGGAIVNNGTFIWIDLLLHESDFGTVPSFGSLVYNWGIVTETYSPVQATPIQPQSCPIYPPYENGVLSQGVHGSDYSPPQPNSLDYVGGRGVNVLSPISGVVTVNEIRYFGANNEYGNTTIIIENDCYSVLMYHGDWTAHVGEEVEMGGPVGTEGNNGYTFDEYDNYCGTGSSCGYHTHMYTFDKILGVGIDPRERYTE